MVAWMVFVSGMLGPLLHFRGGISVGTNALMELLIRHFLLLSCLDVRAGGPTLKNQD